MARISCMENRSVARPASSFSPPTVSSAMQPPAVSIPVYLKPQWGRTPVFLLATAGLRKLAEGDREALMAAAKSELLAPGLRWESCFRGCNFVMKFSRKCCAHYQICSSHQVETTERQVTLMEFTLECKRERSN